MDELESCCNFEQLRHFGHAAQRTLTALKPSPEMAECAKALIVVGVRGAARRTWISSQHEGVSPKECVAHTPPRRIAVSFSTKPTTSGFTRTLLSAGKIRSTAIGP